MPRSVSPVHPLRAAIATATALAMTVLAAVIPAQTAAAQPGDGPVGPETRQPVAAPRLAARATLSADHLAPGPPSGSGVTMPANGRKGPFAGQVIPGFSAAVAHHHGTFWAMPDNGFGAKDNSADFLLRIYLVKPRWEQAAGGSGAIRVRRFISLRDPDHKIAFPIVNEDTDDRLLTGADFDIESLQRAKDGSFWLGEEFGPYLLHVSRTGRVLSAPVPSPLGKSPQHPQLGSETANVPRSGGFEAMAKSPTGRFLYPIVEKGLADDPDPRRRVIAQFDTRYGEYTGRTWSYRVDTDANLVADAQMIGGGRLLVLERDDFDGEAAVTKRIYRVALDRTEGSGHLAKTLLVDLLKIDNPYGLGGGEAWGTGNPFSFGLVSVETLVPLPGGDLMIANDNNYPGNAARVPGTPDDTEMIIIDPYASRAEPVHDAEVIAHRGASGYRPEHTLASYALAIRQCADVIEPDVVSTKDGVLVARHENNIRLTTDVAEHPEFAGKRTTKTIDGSDENGWFVEDFTLSELRTLRAIERIPDLRSENEAFNGLYPVPTLAEILDLARHSRTCEGRPVGVAPETKHPTYFSQLHPALPLEPPLLKELAAAGLNTGDAPVIIQSFETTNLKQLNLLTDVRLLQLINCSGRPWDLEAAGDQRRYRDLATRSGLQEIATYADEVGFCKNLMIPRDVDNRLAAPTAVIGDAHDAGLDVIGWTFRRENDFLPVDFRIGNDPAGVGNLAGEIQTFLNAGMDGFFTDNPDVGVKVALPEEAFAS